MLLRKCVYLYEYMDDCEQFNETLLPEKKKLYSSLNMEHIRDADFKHVIAACNDFQIK